MSGKKIKKDKACIKCKEVPEDGFFHSYVVNYHWVCPECSKKQVYENRKKRKKLVTFNKRIAITKPIEPIESGVGDVVEKGRSLSDTFPYLKLLKNNTTKRSVN